MLDTVTREGLCQAVIDIYRVWNSNVKYDSTTTDELGFYIRKLESGKYKLVISMPNYVTITEYTVVSGGKTTLDPLLYAVPTGCHKMLPDGAYSITVFVLGPPFAIIWMFWFMN